MKTTEKVMTNSTKEMTNFEIIDYSEKAIAVVGDTREIKDQLKALGGRFNPRLTCGAGWIFSKSKREAVEALQRGEVVASKCAKAEPKAQPLPDYFLTADERREFWIAEGEKEGRYLDFLCKRYPLAVRLTDGRVIFCERHELETSFCFGHGQNGMTTQEDSQRARECERFASSDERYFIDENMKGIRDRVKMAKGAYNGTGGSEKCYTYSVRPKEGRKSQEVYFSDYTKEELLGGCDYHFYLGKDQAESLTLIEGEDRQRIVALYEAEEANRLRRVQTYLKKYGLSKLRTWTYLVD